MNYRLVLFALLFLPSLQTSAQDLRLSDAYPEKARYAPNEPVKLAVELAGKPAGSEQITASIFQLGKPAGQCAPIRLTAASTQVQILECSLPKEDFQGYLVDLRLSNAAGQPLDERQTAIDISSDWKRFPRYGYLAHYNSDEGAQPQEWIEHLNRFHINGLEFYDFQFRHDQPLAGTVAQPAAEWKDIAARRVDGGMLRAFIDQAHNYNMTAMAYNASYSAYDDAFLRKTDPLPLQWGTWTTADGPRTPATAKRLELHASGWSTSSLFYMNQNSLEWQHHLFGQMQDLFAVYPFDGWHIDTFGEKGAYAFDGSAVSYIDGFRPYINNASATLHKRIVFNAVNTFGQEQIARSAADFVYSELWEDHETFASILETAEQVRLANPDKGIVFAAYLHRRETKDSPTIPAKAFNLPAVLLADAAIFASGASHIELGDGPRMLSNEYFPADTSFVVTPALSEALRHYYDYLTAYENYLRDGLQPSAVQVHIRGEISDSLAVPDTLWTLAFRKDKTTVLHLINLKGSSDPHWRDVDRTRPEPPVLQDLQIEVSSPEQVKTVGWASPDFDGGKFHSLPFTLHKFEGSYRIECRLPRLRYWDTIFLSQ